MKGAVKLTNRHDKDNKFHSRIRSFRLTNNLFLDRRFSSLRSSANCSSFSLWMSVFPNFSASILTGGYLFLTVVASAELRGKKIVEFLFALRRSNWILFTATKKALNACFLLLLFKSTKVNWKKSICCWNENPCGEFMCRAVRYVYTEC